MYVYVQYIRIETIRKILEVIRNIFILSLFSSFFLTKEVVSSTKSNFQYIINKYLEIQNIEDTIKF